MISDSPRHAQLGIKNAKRWRAVFGNKPIRGIAAAAYFNVEDQPDVSSVEWRLWQIYSTIVSTQMEKVEKKGIVRTDLRELLKALAAPRIFNGSTSVSDAEFCCRQQKVRHRRWYFAYTAAGVMAVIRALRLFEFKRGDTVNDPSGRRRRLGLLFRELDSTEIGIGGVVIKFEVSPRGNTRKYVVRLDASALRLRA
jgi:hypothetical protein